VKLISICLEERDRKRANLVCVKPLAMYSCISESNDAVSVTEDRNGKRPTNSLSVDTEEALNAGHAAELSSDMQLCAIADGTTAANSTQAAVDVRMCEVFRRFGNRRPGAVLWCARRLSSSIIPRAE
jgi:hypothetical protein